jgi:hypothetical protein
LLYNLSDFSHFCFSFLLIIVFLGVLSCVHCSHSQRIDISRLSPTPLNPPAASLGSFVGTRVDVGVMRASGMFCCSWRATGIAGEVGNNVGNRASTGTSGTFGRNRIAAGRTGVTRMLVSTPTRNVKERKERSSHRPALRARKKPYLMTMNMTMNMSMNMLGIVGVAVDASVAD